jgi:hypothetical protein
MKSFLRLIVVTLLRSCGLYGLSLKMANEALAVLEVPKKEAAILPDHGWRPPEEDVVKIKTGGGEGGCH